MKVSIIIINYNTFRITSDCIRSVIANTRSASYQIILVDNASTECSPAEFLQEFPEIILIENKGNGGFAYGNNAGIERAAGDFILLLNSDTILNEDSISKSAGYLENRPDAGILGCRMVYPNGAVQYSARRFRSISWELLDLFRFVVFLMPYRKRAGLMLGKYFRHDVDTDCDWVSGAFFLFPRKLMDQFPGKKLDDRFFMYGEDQLWCEQALESGYKTIFYSGTTIMHINSASTLLSKQLALRRRMIKNELAIMRLRKGSGLYFFTFKIIFVAKETMRNLVKSVSFRLTGRMMR